QGGEWRVEGRVAGMPHEVATIVEGENGTVWCGTNEGIVGVRVPAAGLAAARIVTRYGDRDSRVFRVAGHIVAVVWDYLLRLDEATGTFAFDPVLAPFAGQGAPGRLAEDAAGNLWATTRPLSVLIRRGASFAPAPRSLHEVPARSVEWVYPEADGTVW